MTWRLALLVGITMASGSSRTMAPFVRDGLKAASYTLLHSQRRPAADMQRVPQFENDRAVSWKSVIPPHTESTLHRHDRFRTIVGIVGGDLTTVSADGHRTVTRYETGKAYWQEPMAAGAMHKDLNDTNKTIEVMVVEVK
jgi:hypothetical protein